MAEDGPTNHVQAGVDAIRLADERTRERDAALAEVERLRGELAGVACSCGNESRRPPLHAHGCPVFQVWSWRDQDIRGELEHLRALVDDLAVRDAQDLDMTVPLLQAHLHECQRQRDEARRLAMMFLEYGTEGIDHATLPDWVRGKQW